MNSSWREACIARLASRAFGGGAIRSGPVRIGAEVELIPVEAGSRRIAAIDHSAKPATLSALRDVARRVGWTERRSPKSGLPEFLAANGGLVTFEPGGQVEYASPPMGSISGLLGDLHRVIGLIRDALADGELDAVFSGIDPVNAIEDVPLQIEALRYRRMDAHFGSIGPDGARMMRQTASVQVNLDLGDDPFGRWLLLNSLAPYLAAMFANAPMYGGRLLEDASMRRLAWGRLDPARTGLPFDRGAPVEAYADFAFGAAEILGPSDEPPFPAFGEIPMNSDGLDRWDRHLSTLFPEVRPRGYFEVRSIDALDPGWYAAPIVMIAGLTLDPAVAREAAEVAGHPDDSLLEPAGHLALADPRLGLVAGELARLALRGAESLGRGMVAPADLEEAEAFFDRFTWVGRTPADTCTANLA